MAKKAYKVSTACVMEADSPVEAAREAAWWNKNNLVFTVSDGTTETEIDFSTDDDYA